MIKQKKLNQNNQNDHGEIILYQSENGQTVCHRNW